MATLTGQNIANTYKQLLQIGSDNAGLTTSVQTVQEGSGTNSALHNYFSLEHDVDTEIRMCHIWQLPFCY